MFESHRDSAIAMLYDLMKKESTRQSLNAAAHPRGKAAETACEFPPLDRLLKKMPWTNWVTPDNSPAEKHEPEEETSPLAKSPQSVRSAKATVNAFGMTPNPLDPAPKAPKESEKDDKLTVLSRRPCMDFIWADVEVLDNVFRNR